MTCMLSFVFTMPKEVQAAVGDKKGPLVEVTNAQGVWQYFCCGNTSESACSQSAAIICPDGWDKKEN